LSDRRVVCGAARQVEWFERRDDGGMFDAEVGVCPDDGGYRAYVMDGWGGGVMSPPHPTLEEAVRDVERLWEMQYG
jgi:hypothetical protein